MSSRREVNLTRAIANAGEIRISKDNLSVRNDLSTYIAEIDFQVEQSGMPDNQSMLAEIRNTLEHKADAM